ncbi:MAG: hypothetical protein JRN52_00055 [Nitrososphaerota archaeon]|nr:hypothetical protein [Nitrososphaerota archaeon]
MKIDILRSISEGNHKHNHIMYSAQLPWKKCKAVINTMEQQGLVQRIDSTEGKKITGYVLTDRGNRALDAFTIGLRELNSKVQTAKEPDSGTALVKQAIATKN